MGFTFIAWYTDEIADDPFNVLGFDPFALGGRREANNRSATVVSTTGKQREPFLQQWQYVQRPYAVHGAGRRRPPTERFTNRFATSWART